MLVTLSGIVTDDSVEADVKALLLMPVTQSPISTDTRPVPFISF